MFYGSVLVYGQCYLKHRWSLAAFHPIKGQKALDYYHQAIPLLRTVGAQAEEAIALDGLGRIHQSLGEIQKALDYYDQSLQIRRSQ